MNRPLTAKYRKYANGGDYDGNQGSGAGWQAGVGLAQMGVGIADAATNNVDAEGLQKPSLGMDIAKGAVSGAAAGSVVPGIGTAIGAVVGGAVGWIGGEAKQNKYQSLHSQYMMNARNSFLQKGRNAITANPSLVTGNLSANYYAEGGPLTKGRSPVRYVSVPYGQSGAMSTTRTVDLNSKSKIASPNSRGYVYNFNSLDASGNRSVMTDEELAPWYQQGSNVHNNFAVGVPGQMDSVYLAPGASKYDVRLPYAAGGSLSKQYLSGDNVANQPMQGGSATPLSSTAAEFNGPSHEGGGIQIPGANAEVEGKETTEGDYVFSSRLGFAQAHKPLARAIGKIEGKALSPERVNSLKLLNEKVQMLKLSQEYLKSQLQPQ